VTPDELAAIGQALYGEQWQTSIARDLGVNARTVRKWLAGDRPITPPTAIAIRSLIDREPETVARILERKHQK
jgi:plasmid maintenance system antidote protein VapI